MHTGFVCNERTAQMLKELFACSQYDLAQAVPSKRGRNYTPPKKKSKKKH